MGRHRRKSEKNNIAFGTFFAGMRQAHNISQDALADNLLTGRAISKLEQYGTMPDALVFDALIRRLGASTQFFMTMLSESEYEYLCWKESILRKIEDGSIQPEDLDSDMANARHIHETLQEQFTEFWKGYVLCDETRMERAIAATVTGYPQPLSAEQCLSTEEIMYILLHLEMRGSSGSFDEKQLTETLSSILCYIEKCCPVEEQIKVYAKAVCLFGEYAKDVSPEEKIRCYRRALELHRKQAVVTGICSVLQGLLREEAHLKAEEREMYRHALFALTRVKEEFQVEEPSLMRGEVNRQFCLLHEVLGAYRQERKLKIRDIDKHACSEKTYRALEAGKRNAKKSTWKSLADYMEIPIDSYNTEIISDRYQDLALAAEIKKLLHLQKDEIALYKLLELEKCLGDKAKIKQNVQFISSIKNIMSYEAGEISLDEYQKQVEDAIRLTIPDWNIDYGTHFYTEREMTLVYYYALILRGRGDYDAAISLVRMLWNQLEQSHVLLIHRSNEALLINTLWKDLLTDIEDYEGALEKVKIGVELSFATGKGEFLDVYTFEPGWITHVRQESLTGSEHAKCLNYFQSAYYISRLFDRKKSQKIIRNYCSDNGFDLMF